MTWLDLFADFFGRPSVTGSMTFEDATHGRATIDTELPALVDHKVPRPSAPVSSVSPVNASAPPTVVDRSGGKAGSRSPFQEPVRGSVERTSSTAFPSGSTRTARS